MAQAVTSAAMTPSPLPRPSPQRPLSPSLVSSPKTLKATTSLFPSRNPLQSAPDAVTQRSGDMVGAPAKRKRERLRSTLLRAWSGRILEVLHPLPRPLAERALRPDTPIDPMFHVSHPPGPTAPGSHPDLAFTEMTLLPHSLALPSNARSMMWSPSGKRLTPVPGWRISGSRWPKIILTISVSSLLLCHFQAGNPHPSISSVVPSEDAHGSEYVAACDKRREWISG